MLGFEQGFDHKNVPHSAGHIPRLCKENEVNTLAIPQHVGAVVTNDWCIMSLDVFT